MNVLEKYASSCGVKLDSPTVASSYFPLPYDRYIVIDNRNRNGMNVYDMYTDVIAYIAPVLKEHGIGIISLCKDTKSIIEKTRPYISLNKKQEAYILDNSLLNVCSDNLSSYFSSALDVPSISLYATYPADINKPIWSEKHLCIESKRSGNLPAYGVKEDPKSINFIEPEKIAQAVFDKLNIDKKIKWESIFIGDHYPVKIVEVIPDFVADPSFMKSRALNVRMDHHFDEKILCYWLKDRYLNILTDKPINIDILKYFKKNVAQFTVSINDEFTEEYLKSVQEIGIKLEIFCEDLDKINEYRFKFFDFQVNDSDWKSKEDAGDELTDQTKFVTSKVVLSGGKKYSCYESKKQEKELTGEPEVIYDTPEFWKELDHYRLINELQS
jgi:hypothetical protein